MGAALARGVIAALIVALVLGALAGSAGVGAAQEGDTGAPPAYVVRPGDTLSAIADRAGVPVPALMRLNHLRSPRDLVPGQPLDLGPAVAALDWAPRPVGWGEDLLVLSRAAGVTVATAAERNRLLLPVGLPLGRQLRLPAAGDVAEVATPAGDPAPRVALALRRQVPLWDVLWLNPLPSVAGLPLLAPAAAVTETLAGPYPLVDVTLAPQPIARGEAAVVTVTAAEPVSCTLHFLDWTSSCYGDDPQGRRWYGLVGVPALLDPGHYTLTLNLQAPASPAVSVPLPLVVGAGRYDYERIDFAASGGQPQADPARVQAERDKIAALRQVRTPQRAWTYPFLRPLDAGVTSYYGSRRSYGYGFSTYHAGTDFRAEIGAPVLAPAAGVVVLAEPLVVRGNAVMIDHGGGVMTGYWHLSRIAVVVGQTVARGELLGGVGNTGSSTGPHLHWELWVDGVAVNPLSWLAPAGPPAALFPGP